MPSRSTYCLTWVSLTLDEGCLLRAAPPDLERGIAPLGPPVPAQPLLLGHGTSLHGCSSKAQLQLFTLEEVVPPDLESGVAPLGPHSRCYLLDVGLLLSAAAPDLGRGVVTLSHASAWSVTDISCKDGLDKGQR